MNGRMFWVYLNYEGTLVPTSKRSSRPPGKTHLSIQEDVSRVF